MRMIEFAGARAVGKSTMMHYLVKAYPQTFIEGALEYPSKREVKNEHTFPQHAEFERFVRQTFTRFPVNAAKLPRSYWIALRDYDVRKASGDRRIAVFDQGLVQYARSLMLITQSRELVRTYLALAPVTDMVFLFDASEQTIKARNYTRGTKLKRGHLPLMLAAVEEIKACVGKRTQLVVIDAEPDIGTKAGRLVQILSPSSDNETVSNFTGSRAAG